MMARTQEVKSVAEPVALPQAPSVTDWLDMPTLPDNGAPGAFPFDGAPVMLTPDGVSSIVATWRQTNTFDKSQKPPRWVRSAFWARRDFVNQAIDFEPLGYRKPDEQRL